MGVIGFLLALLILTVFYSVFYSVEVKQSSLYYIPLVIVAVWYSNRSIWTAAALSLGYVVVTLFLAISGYSIDPVLLFLFTLLYLWGMTAVILFSPEQSYHAGALCDSSLFFSLDPKSFEVRGISHDLAARLGLPGHSLENTVPLASICVDPGEAQSLVRQIRSAAG